ncbi:hypothetical protein [Tautonia plasticadhaerens]|uniref:Uncharacterized protein n=1 Tax=Tautonia plasticadhaerens TaxID=2527974 RepID=A0A518HDT1_9BACT|nr:hypothetical protein [Tautonia plasticadhaerens]QDV39011.1 hypothetical protein ElP_69720 [Tautonia plasticadhaerens]
MAALTIPEEARGTPRASARWGEALAGTVVFGLWFLLYAAGALVGTGPARERVMAGAPPLEAIRLLTLILLCYTATNVAILCIIGSQLGGLFRRVREGLQGRPTPTSMPSLMFALGLQGFVIYLVIVSGVISFSGGYAFLSSPNQDQYMRLAATASLFSFVVGYSPTAIVALLARLERLLGAGAPSTGGDPGAVA